MAVVYRLRGCKKCGGDLLLDIDSYGYYIKCFQCATDYIYENSNNSASKELIEENTVANKNENKPFQSQYKFLCKQGHEFTENNTVIITGTFGMLQRRCKECFLAENEINDEH